jgi:EAL domain-containing protein (putative c-di-GMP-specific phosphodiesterase class I)/CheY-like chemotaxis protein
MPEVKEPSAPQSGHFDPSRGEGFEASDRTESDEVRARVLVVDDEPAIARGLTRVLGLAGHVVTSAMSGEEAVALLASQSFDVILSDIRMPRMDGLTLLRAIRAKDLDVPVAFMTGDPAVETAVEAMEHGAFRYLLKPVDSEEVVAVVERAARLHRLARVRRDAADALESKRLGDRAGLETRFAAGVEKLWMAMQPVLSWSGRSVYAYEALLRTDEPTLRNPTDFVEAAERLGRTRELGRIIRRRLAAEFPSVPSGATLFINLHPSDLVDEELGAADGALTPFASRIVLEVTERATLDEVRGLSDAVARLRALGFRIALDDLGAGYAGLSSFALLEPEIVKVDMSLVRGIHASPMKQKLFRSFTTLCEELGVVLVAEGVEVAEERDCLTRLGGDLYQGYLFARPERGFPTPVF